MSDAPWKNYEIINKFPWAPGISSEIQNGYTEQLEGIVPRMGAKSKLRDWLIDHFPRHHSYVEPFGGSFKVLLWKSRSKIEIINDIDEDLVHFFRFVTYWPDTLADMINNLPTHQGILKFLRSQLIAKELSGLERAAATYYSIKLSFNGTGNGYSGDPRTLASARADKKEFKKVSDRLRGVDIRCMNAHDLIRQVNKDIGPSYPGGIFFYLDPPYDETAGYNTLTSKSIYGKEQQFELFNLCKEIHKNNNKFMMTNSYTEFLRNLYGKEEGWYSVKRMVKYDISGNADAREEVAELIVSNFPITDKPNIGGLFK